MTGFFAVLTLAVGLAMDATAVAATKGFATKKVRTSDTARIAFLFGGFQAGMPVIGWAIGDRFARLIEAWQHWVAFVLLAGIGGKMIWEVVRGDDEDEKGDKPNPFGWRTLIVLAIATSIDALVAGLTLPLLGLPILVAAAMIGITTAALSVLGLHLGRRFGARIGKKLDVLGGLLLVGLGAKILITHLLER